MVKIYPAPFMVVSSACQSSTLAIIKEDVNNQNTETQWTLITNTAIEREQI